MMLCAENTFDPNRGLAELRKSAPTTSSYFHSAQLMSTPQFPRWFKMTLFYSGWQKRLNTYLKITQYEPSNSDGWKGAMDEKISSLPCPAKTAGRVKIISGIHKIAQPSNLSNTTYLICISFSFCILQPPPSPQSVVDPARIRCCQLSPAQID